MLYDCSHKTCTLD